MSLGFLSNALVMGVNHSQMPVNMPPGVLINPDDIFHTAMNSATHLKILADWIVLAEGIASPGDFLLWGAALATFPMLIAWIALILKEKN